MPRTGRPPKYDYMPRSGLVVIDPARLRYWRNVRGLTRDELAGLARLATDTICSYEKGRRCPREMSFRKILTALGIGAEDLLFPDGRYIKKQDKEEE